MIPTTATLAILSRGVRNVFNIMLLLFLPVVEDGEDNVDGKDDASDDTEAAKRMALLKSRGWTGSIPCVRRKLLIELKADCARRYKENGTNSVQDGLHSPRNLVSKEDAKDEGDGDEEVATDADVAQKDGVDVDAKGYRPVGYRKRHQHVHTVDIVVVLGRNPNVAAVA